MIEQESVTPLKVTVSKSQGVDVPCEKSITINGVCLDGIASAEISMTPGRVTTLTLVIEDFDISTK